MSNIQKYYYLQASLKGEAAHFIESLEISDSNYTVAWALPQDRYENKKIIIKNHIKCLFYLPTINKESFSALRNFVVNFQKNFRAVKNLNEILIHLLLTKSDFNTKKEWEIKTKNEISPQLNTFITFLTNRCHILESVDSNKLNPHSQQQTPISGKRGYLNKPYLQSNVSANINLTLSCLYCKEDHNIYYCNDFQKLTVSDRLNTIRKLKACVNCLRLGHTSNDCRGKRCRICQNEHNTLLQINNGAQRTFNNKSNHGQNQQRENISNSAAGSSTSVDIAPNKFKKAEEQNDNDQRIIECTQNLNNPHVNSFAGFTSSPFVILSTALVNILDKEGKYITGRALLDGRAQSNFISRDLFETLNIDPINVKIQVIGINGHASNICNAVKTKMKSNLSIYIFDLQFLVTDKITTNTPQFTFEITNFNLSSNINLADPQFNQSQAVDLLLGTGIFYNLLLQGQICLGKNLPLLQNTKLGWIVAGSVGGNFVQNNIISNFSEQILENKVERFWFQEELPYKENKYTQENEVESHFNSTVSKDTEGNFEVRLPFHDNFKTRLGASYAIAVNRFQSLERKLLRNQDLREKYNKFMAEYTELGHMSEINFDNTNIRGSNYFLPHHDVFKESSLTTKLRVVFDASSKTTSGVSLNDVLKIGPVIQDSLFFILLRFRVHSIVITADIAKMSRCVKVQKDDRAFQQIVWRNNPLDSLKIYQLNTVTYGTGPASFIATRCHKQLATDNETGSSKVCPEAALSGSSKVHTHRFLYGRLSSRW